MKVVRRPCCWGDEQQKGDDGLPKKIAPAATKKRGGKRCWAEDFSGESVKQSLKSGELSLERKLSRYDFYSLLSSHWFSFLVVFFGALICWLVWTSRATRLFCWIYSLYACSVLVLFWSFCLLLWTFDALLLLLTWCIKNHCSCSLLIPPIYSPLTFMK